MVSCPLKSFMNVLKHLESMHHLRTPELSPYKSSSITSHLTEPLPAPLYTVRSLKLTSPAFIFILLTQYLLKSHWCHSTPYTSSTLPCLRASTELAISLLLLLHHHKLTPSARIPPCPWILCAHGSSKFKGSCSVGMHALHVPGNRVFSVLGTSLIMSNEGISHAFS